MILALVVACGSSPTPTAPPPAPAPALRTRAATPADDPAPAPEGPSPKVDRRLHREFATTAEGVAFLDGVVAPLLEGAALGVDVSAVVHACAEDGRRCSFEGPWRDDLQGRWIRAVATGATDLDALQGVRVTAFRKRDTPHGARFVLEAHAP